MELPPLSDRDGGGDEIVAGNVRAVAVIYFAFLLEQLNLIQVIDRIVELWSDGQLPLTSGPAGDTLDRWNRNSSGRMTYADRMTQFTRVIGAMGGEVSKEVAPNTDFDEHFLRFVSYLSEYHRQTTSSNAVRNSDVGTVSDAQVRKAGRDLAVNVSLYGSGNSQFAARRLSTEITDAMGILEMPDIQSACGAQSAWQVVERVCSQELNCTAQVAKYRTMAESGKTILDLVAKYDKVWSSTDAPLFCPPENVTDNDCSIECDISVPDQRALMHHSESWLVANAEA